jgi:hypothetical protein
MLNHGKQHKRNIPINKQELIGGNMPGMPSARGVEWKGLKGAHTNFQKGYDSIPRDEKGNMLLNPIREEKPIIENKIPVKCNDCDYCKNGMCPDSCGNGTSECFERIYGTK